MLLTGNEDLRVRRTIEAIKKAFEELICETDYEKIKVTELCQRAMINKKTFYVYYPTLDDLLAEMQAELSSGYLERIKEYKLPDDLDKINREFFMFSEEQGLAYEKITCAANNSLHYIRSGMMKKVNDAGWGSSVKFNALPDHEKPVIINYVNNTVLSIYRQWIEDGKQQKVDEIIELTNRLVLGGVNGFFGK